MKFKWITDLNVKPKTIKFIEENIDKILCNVDLGRDLLEHKNS